jgi:hypothetical protein
VVTVGRTVVVTELPHEPERHPQLGVSEFHRAAESRLALAAMTHREQLSNPRFIGFLAGVPSHRPPGSVTADEIWTLADEERHFKH